MDAIPKSAGADWAPGDLCAATRDAVSDNDLPAASRGTGLSSSVPCASLWQCPLPLRRGLPRLREDSVAAGDLPSSKPVVCGFAVGQRVSIRKGDGTWSTGTVKALGSQSVIPLYWVEEEGTGSELACFRDKIHPCRSTPKGKQNDVSQETVWSMDRVPCF